MSFASRNIPQLLHFALPIPKILVTIFKNQLTHLGPVEPLHVDEDPHELRDCEGGVGVVQLDGHLLRQLGQVQLGHPGASVEFQYKFEWSSNFIYNSI